MDSPRATLLLLPCPAMLVLLASFVGVNASTCLPSAPAVRQVHPGAWPSWTLRAPGHEGVRCWYPATRTTAHNHRYETVPNRNTRNFGSAIKEMGRDRSPMASLGETNGLGWSLQSRTAQVGAVLLPGDGSFADRFAAVYERDLLPSTIQRIMDLTGSIQ
jgi:hypothetical protein